MSVTIQKSQAELDAELDKLDDQEDQDDAATQDEDGGAEGQDNDTQDDQDDAGDESEDEDGGDAQEQEEKVDEDKEKLKQKYSESSREATILHEKNRMFTQSVDKAAEVTVTDEEVKAVYTSWDDMSDVEKALARDNVLNKKKFNLIHETVQSTKKTDQWLEKVDTFLGDEANLSKYSQLAGRESEFKHYASKPNHVGVDMEVLVNAFSNQANIRTKKHGSLFQTGKGGERPAKKEMTADDVSVLRKTDPRRYQALIRAGKINISI